MTSGDLAALLSELLDIPFSTIDLYGRRLRAAGLLSVKGHGRGAAQMTTMDVAVWLVALCVDHKRGGDFIDEVQRTLNLPLCDCTAVPETAGSNLAVSNAKRMGDCIAALVSDTLAPRFAKAMAKRQDIFVLTFDAEGDRAGLSLTNKKNGMEFESVIWTFQHGDYDDRPRRNLERVTAINGVVLFAIAKAMGIVPPPPY
jgi:hypothetical protein